MKQKNKNIFLLSGFVMAFVIAYQLAFLPTITSKKDLEILYQKSKEFENFETDSSTLNQREKFVDSVLKKHEFKNISIQNSLLEFLNTESKNNSFSIVNFNEPHTVNEDNIIITSFQFSLMGCFEELQQIIYKIEQNYNFGQISHVNFEKKRDYRKNRDYLECFVIIEAE
jgi:hypothetical protein